jgi:hypothetical protein
MCKLSITFFVRSVGMKSIFDCLLVVFASQYENDRRKKKGTMLPQAVNCLVQKSYR